MSQSRIYTVIDSESTDKHLVRASSAAQAIAHVSKRFSAAVASQDELVHLLGASVAVEDYKPSKVTA